MTTLNADLTDFVRRALAAGSPRADVAAVLRRVGWTDDAVDTAIGSYADVDFPIPVPRPRAYLSAREAFTYLLLFSMLYVSAYDVGVLVFQFIDQLYPDPLASASPAYARDAVRWALSSLIVSFPVFLFLSIRTERSVRREPAKRRSNVRRWLMYLTTFIGAAMLIGDVTVLAHTALAGDLSVRFILKVLGIASIAGLPLAYYLSDLRLEDTRQAAAPGRLRTAVGAIAVIGVVAAAGLGFYTTGAPSEERLRRADERRIRDLRELTLAVGVYHSRHQQLPSSIDDVIKEGGLRVDSRDPAGIAYEYRTMTNRTYEVCATFNRASDAPGANDTWSHGAGRTCFAQAIEKTPE